AAQAIAVTLHELATNAAKYGALSVAKGQVELKWSHEADERLILRWMEMGGPERRLSSERTITSARASTRLGTSCVGIHCPSSFIDLHHERRRLWIAKRLVRRRSPLALRSSSAQLFVGTFHAGEKDAIRSKRYVCNGRICRTLRHVHPRDGLHDRRSPARRTFLRCYAAARQPISRAFGRDGSARARL